MENDNIHIVKSPLSNHLGHRCRSLIIDKSMGIKAVYCQNCSKITEYVFRKAKGWTQEPAQNFADLHASQFKSIKHISVDQELELIKTIATKIDDSTEEFKSSAPSFILEKIHIENNLEGEEENPMSLEKDAQTNENVQEVSIVKVDEDRRLAYGVFLYPEKADHDGDVISGDDIEKVAHGFMEDYRDIDEMHAKETMDAEIVESFIAWQDDLDFHGKKLNRGTWAGAIHVNDEKVWEKIKDGTYKGFSVRISGIREPITNK